MKATTWIRLGVCALSWSGVALGQAPAKPSDEQLADRDFATALELMEAKRYAEARPLLEESQRLAPASGTLLNLADCYQELGRLTLALETFSQAAELARRTGNIARQQVAEQRKQALAPRLAHVIVTAPNAPPGLTLTLDGKELPEKFWARPQAVDPGAHAVRATAPGKQAHEIALGPLPEGATRSVEIPPLAPLAAAELTPADEAPGQEPRATDWQTVGAITSAALGTVAVVGGTLFAVHSQSKHEESDRYCDGSRCSDPQGVDAMHDAIIAGDRATACFIVAGVGLSVAGVLWFVRPFDSDDPGPTQVAVGPGRLELRVRW